jgi:ABC-type glycerol-3-phosphate transport system substrate-binding protein
MRRNLWLLLIILLLLSGCSLFDEQESGTAATLTAAVPTVAATPTNDVTPEATEPAAPPRPRTLNIWMIDEISSRADTAGGTILAEQLTAFQTSHPDVDVNVEVKTVTGQGGTLNYLRTGRNVAPSILPDLIVLPVDQIATAVSEELIFPIDEMISQEMRADLFPVAASMSRIGENSYGYPFALSNLTQIAYSTETFTETLPSVWEEFLALEESTFIFPAGGLPGAELVLQLYLASGGRILNESKEIMLEQEPLTDALTLLRRGGEVGLIPLRVISLASLDEIWTELADDPEIIVITSAALFNSQELDPAVTGFTSIPGPEKPLNPLLKGWVWAVSTAEPARQALAAELLEWLSKAPNLGEWSLVAGKLPARRTALEQWAEGDPYVTFLKSELRRADPYPTEATDVLFEALGQAVSNVMSQAKSPQIAAREAIEALQG